MPVKLKVYVNEDDALLLLEHRRADCRLSRVRDRAEADRRRRHCQSDVPAEPHRFRERAGAATRRRFAAAQVVHGVALPALLVDGSRRRHRRHRVVSRRAGDSSGDGPGRTGRRVERLESCPDAGRRRGRRLHAVLQSRLRHLAVRRAVPRPEAHDAGAVQGHHRPQGRHHDPPFPCLATCGSRCCERCSWRRPSRATSMRHCSSSATTSWWMRSSDLGHMHTSSCPTDRSARGKPRRWPTRASATKTRPRAPRSSPPAWTWRPIDRFISPGPLGHNKFLVRTGSTGHPLSVWTGSTNWTPTGLVHPGQQRPARCEDRDVAALYLDQWHRLREAGNDFPPALTTSNATPKPVGADVAGTVRSRHLVHQDEATART